MIAVDEQGRPLAPALVWLDNRATDEAREIARRFDDATVYAVTGVPSVIPTWTACKILWWRRHEPDLFGRAARFLLVEDFVLHRLTGRFVTEGGVACTLAPLRHRRAALVGAHARGRRHRSQIGCRSWSRPAPSSARSRRAAAAALGLPAASARRGRRDGPVRRRGRRRQRRPRRRLGEQRRGADPAGFGRPPRRRPDAPDARLHPLGARPVPLLPGLPHRRHGAHLVSQPVRRRRGGRAPSARAAAPTTC